MTRWWKRVAAAVAAMLGVGVACQAQVYTPSAVGAARMPEPIRYDAPPPPNLVPGPLTPQMAPMGPPPGMDLPDRHSSAFQTEHYSLEAAWYVHAGLMYLNRGRAERLNFVYRDSGTTPGIEDGVLRTPQAIRRSGAVELPSTGAAQLTLGYLVGNYAIEATGIYMPENNKSRTFTDQGRLFLPFANSNGTQPVAFLGNNGMFTQADAVRYRFTHELSGAELNCRTWNGGLNTFEVLLGVRYLHLKEGIDLAVYDDIGPRASSATYRADVTTQFGGLQVGTEYGYQVCNCAILDRLWLHGQAKAAFGVNRIDRDLRLLRGDGGARIGASTEKYQFGQLYDLQGGVDVHLSDRCRMRFAYQAFWLLGTTTPGSSVDFNLDGQGSRGIRSKDVLYHGPLLELQLLF